MLVSSCLSLSVPFSIWYPEFPLWYPVREGVVANCPDAVQTSSAINMMTFAVE